MMLITELRSHINKIITELYGVEVLEMTVEHPAKEKFGDYAVNIALVLSKKLQQSPIEIANKISSRLQVEKDSGGYFSIYSDISVVNPGFINFKLSDKWLNNVLTDIRTVNKYYGDQNIGQNQRIALEHSNVNPNKAAHIGHLRNACIGQFIERVYESLGYRVEVQYYANNIGVQVATSNMGVNKIKSISPKKYKKFDHYAWDVYAAMETMIAENPELNEERMKLMSKLEDPLSKESISQKKLANKILSEQLKTFRDIGFDYDVVIYESDILNLRMWEKAYEELKNNENVYFADEGVSKGCWLVKMTGGNQDQTLQGAENELKDIEKDKIIVRSNGIATYTGKDIAYHMWKFGLLGIDFGYTKLDIKTQDKTLWSTTSDMKNSEKDISFSGVDCVYDVIGGEQTYAMGVVKQALGDLGYDVQAANMRHINYGFVFLSKNTAEKLGMDTSDGKKFYEMSGRKGWGVKIDDFVELVDKELLAKYGSFEYTRDVRNAAIKFQMLKNNTFQDLVFDLDDALDLRGYSGPYIQYTFVRTHSLLKKSTVDVANIGKDILKHSPDELEKEILRWIYRFPEIMVKASQDFAPNLLCDYLYELCRRFNAFYNSESVLNASADDRDYRLLLTHDVGVVLKKGLWILGIDAPEKM